jgi:hypothetical protein
VLWLGVATHLAASRGLAAAPAGSGRLVFASMLVTRTAACAAVIEACARERV